MAAALIAVSMLPTAIAEAAPGGSENATPKKVSPLSSRLATLARPEVSGLAPKAQNRNLGLPDGGAGSLLRHGKGRILVDVRVSAAAAIPVVAQAASAGIVARNGETATLAVDPTNLAALAAAPGVVSTTEVLTPMLSRSGRSLRSAARAAVTNATCPSGVVSEGDSQLKAALARTTYSIDGAGVKVGVLSDSYDNIGGVAADVASGDLPGVGNPCGYTTPVHVVSDMSSGGSDEGRAMLQIVHDLAPGAELLYATAFNGELDFANQIIALKNAGANVIVDDVTYFDEPMYQDGVVAAAVNTVTSAGVSYFSSAGNSTRTVAGKSIGSYEAPSYRPTTCPAYATWEPLLDCHDFDPGAGTSASNTVSIGNGGTILMSLCWSQPAFGVTTDLDFFLVDVTSTPTLVAYSVVDNVASGLPDEVLVYENNTGTARSYAIVVGRYSGTSTPRIKFISHRSPFTAVQWDTSSGGDVIGPTIFGHNAALNAATIAAVPYNNSNVVEPFSSEGPATSCWQPVNGTTPSSAKPCQTKNLDFAATDGVRTTLSPTSGLNPFYGTSASAPHAAAVNALMRQARPCRNVAELTTAESASGRAVGSFGIKSVGSGLIDAVTAVSKLTPCTSVAQTSTSLATWVEPTTVGQAAWFSAVVTGGSGTPSGTVRFYNGLQFLGTATLTNGVAYTSTVALAAGTHQIQAVYDGDATHAASYSNAVIQRVVPAVYTARFSATEANQINAAMDYYGVPRADALKYGGQVLRFLDFVSGGGLGPVTPAPTSSGPVTLTASYSNPDDVAAVVFLSAKMGLTTEQFHIFGVRVLQFFVYLSTH